MFAVVAGHIGDSEHRVKAGNTGNEVHELLVDYQFEGRCTDANPSTCDAACWASTYTGNGWLRVMTFDPATDEVLNETITVEDGNASIFPGGTPVLFCSDLFGGGGNGGDWYAQDPTAADHLFTFSHDLNTPVTYGYDDLGARGFHDRTVNSAASGDQLAPALAFDGAGGVVAAWEDDSSSADGGGNHDIHVRGFSAGCCEAFSDVVANPDTAGAQEAPTVGVAANGEFVVAWQDDADGNGVFQIHARGFHPDGTQRFARITVNSTAAGQQHQPALAMAPDGRFVVAWEDDQENDGDHRILARRSDAAGTPVAEWTVTPGGGTHLAPTASMNAGGAFALAWEDDGDGNGTFQIRGATWMADGSPWIPEQTLNFVAPGQQLGPAVGSPSSGSTRSDRPRSGQSRDASESRVEATISCKACAVHGFWRKPASPLPANRAVVSCSL